MDETDFEGSLVLECLASINKVDAFFDAIDSDDITKATSLMKKAGLDSATIKQVVEKILSNADH